MKRIEKRLNIVEDWMKQFEQGTGPKQVVDNMNWLITQLRQVGEQTLQMNQQLQDMQNQFQTNVQIVNDFIDENELTIQWNAKLKEIQEEQNNAVQESETKSMDAQEQAQDGEEMGEGDSEGSETSEESKEE